MKMLQHMRGRAGDLGAVLSCPSSVPSERLGEVVTIAVCYAGNRCDLQVLQLEKTGLMQATVTAKRAFGFLDEKESVLWTSMPVLQEALGAVRFFQAHHATVFLNADNVDSILMVLRVSDVCRMNGT